MTETVELPELGEEIERAEVVGVLVSAGDDVEREQSLLEVEADKATVEVPSPRAGRVVEVLVEEGEELEVGQGFLRLETVDGGEDSDTDEGSGRADDEEDESGGDGVNQAADDGPRRTTEESAAESDREDRSRRRAEEPTEARHDGTETGESGGPRARDRQRPAAPSVRRFAREIGVAIERVSGSGPGGRVSIGDVKAYAREAREPGGDLASGDVSSSEEASLDWQRLSRVRRTIGRRMLESWRRAPQVTLHAHADVTAVRQAIELRRDRSEEGDDTPGLTAVLVRVLARALRAHPAANVRPDERGEKFGRRDHVHIGLAVDTERGLLVPVLRDADRKSASELGLEARELAEKARSGRLGTREMSGGCATLTNLGALPIDGFTPILPPGQVVVLGVGRASATPSCVDGRVEPRERLPMSLTFDHRYLDGAAAAGLLAWIVRRLEDPWSSLLDDRDAGSAL